MCTSCRVYTSLKETNVEEYEKWELKHKHNCSLNYQGLSTNMELSGTVSIFSRSITWFALNYYGDGDNNHSKTSKTYEGVKARPNECYKVAYERADIVAFV